MRIEIRSDSVVIDGYVNAVCRQSKPVITEHGKVVEVIEERAFERALARATNVDLLLDHDESKNLGSTEKGNLKLWEDNIGLRAVATITDAETIQKAKDGKLSGWSFGMYVNKDNIEQRAEGLPIRHVEELDIFEVSIIDDKMSPCYSATSIETRAEKECTRETRAWVDTYITVTDSTNIYGDTKNNNLTMTTKRKVETSEVNQIDYSEYENRISKLMSAK